MHDYVRSREAHYNKVTGLRRPVEYRSVLNRKKIKNWIELICTGRLLLTIILMYSVNSSATFEVCLNSNVNPFSKNIGQYYSLNTNKLLMNLI